MFQFNFNTNVPPNQSTQYTSSTQQTSNNNPNMNQFFEEYFNPIFQNSFFNQRPSNNNNDQRNNFQQQQQYQFNTNNQQQQRQPQFNPSNNTFNQQQQNNFQQRNYYQQEPQPTFQNTRNYFRKAEPKREKKRENNQQQTQPLSQNTGSYWKQKGTQAFKEGNYDQAIKFYTKAIEIDNSQSMYYSNRGRCYKIQGSLKKAFEDAVQSIEIDDCNIKGQLLCGQLLCELGKKEEGYQKIENGIKKLTRALTLCANYAGDKKTQYEKEISVYIYRAKKLLWYKQYEDQCNIKIQKIDNYKKYLISLNIQEQKFNQELKEFILLIGNPYQMPDFTIPDYLCCKITLELMEDPYTTEAGHTYEKEAIEDHIKKNGYTDPITRQQIKQFIFPNQSIKQAVQEFIQKNPWAFEYSNEENYRTITF